MLPTPLGSLKRKPRLRTRASILPLKYSVPWAFSLPLAVIEPDRCGSPSSSIRMEISASISTVALPLTLPPGMSMRALNSALPVAQCRDTVVGNLDAVLKVDLVDLVERGCG